MKDDRYTTLRNRILAAMILVPAIPFICISAIGHYHFMTSLESHNISKMRRIVDDHRGMIESFLVERLGDIVFIEDTFTFEELTRPEVLADVFRHLQRKSGAFTDIGVFNAQGIHVAYHGPFELAGKDYKDEPWFRYVLDTGYYISDVFLGYRKIPHFIIAVRKQDDRGVWVVRATIDTSVFSQVVEGIRIGKTGEAYLLNIEGRFQTQRRSGGELMAKDPDLSASLPIHVGVQTFTNKDAVGTKYLYATTWLKNKPWLLVVRQEKGEAYQNLYRVTYLTIFATMVGAAAILFVAFYVTNRIIARIERTDTEKKELGKQLVVAGRLAEIGEMSAGFAHEINNPLQIMRAEQTLIDTILGDLQERGDLRPSADLDELKDSMHQIKLQIDRCAEVTQALLKFARQKESKEQQVRLQDVIPEVTRLVKRKADVEGVSIVQSIPENVPSISADPAQLQQVLVNLFNNAIDAILEARGSGGGELAVEAYAAEDQKVAIVVRDNGCGISADNMEKIFTPFFTTKPVGKGTGLGLSICYGIITSMGGSMEVASIPGYGTTFTIYLKSA